MRDGFLVVDKPEGLTSHDVVGIIRAVTGERSVGHTGTLDPFATGVLALAVGTATKLISFLDESVKVYDATIQLGAATNTGDLTGERVREAPVPNLTDDAVDAVLATFAGERQQTPPAFSAVKKDGRPLYWYARRGQEVEVASRPIHVTSVVRTARTADSLRVRITCSRGTYARVLADEIATALGTAGHLTALAREQSGPFFISDALGFPELGSLVALEPEVAAQGWRAVLRAPRDARPAWRSRPDVSAAIEARLVRPLSVLGHLPLVDVDAAAARRVCNGQLPVLRPSGLAAGERFLVVHGDALLAIAEAGTHAARLVRVMAAP